MRFLWFGEKNLLQTSGQNSGQTFDFSWKSRRTRIQLRFDWGFARVRPKVYFYADYEQPVTTVTYMRKINFTTELNRGPHERIYPPSSS
jgi:hypothetical protein